MPLPALALPLLLNFGPAIFSKLLGGQSQEERMRAEIMKLLSPQNQMRVGNQFYQSNLASPAYAQGQGTIAQGANVAGSQLASSLGARGIGTTGTGAVLSSLMPSLVGSQVAGLKTSAYNSAQQQAQQTIQQQIQALLGTQQQGPSRTAGFLGAGLEGIAPFLQAFLKNKYPGMFGGLGEGGGSTTNINFGAPRMGQAGFTYPLGR